jgi:hypothetical protein
VKFHSVPSGVRNGQGGAAVKAVQRMLRRIDEFQRRHKPLGFMFAVFKKFGEDDAGSKAALIAYYGFFSLFPCCSCSRRFSGSC